MLCHILMQNVSEDIVAVVGGMVEELIYCGQLLGRAVVDLSIPIQCKQPTDVLKGRPIVGRDENTRG